MSQSGFTPIQLYRSATAATLPVAGNLAAGELAINTTDEKLYFENTGGTVTLLASSAATGGTFTTVTATTVVNGLGAVGTPSYTFTGDLNTGMWSPAADTIAFSEGGAEAMRITSAGNVGIGSTAPSAKLDVAAAAFTGGPLIGARYNTANFRMGIGIANANGFPFVGQNVNNSADDNGTFDLNGRASRLRMDSGTFQFETSSVSGTAGNAITWNNSAYLDASGNLGIGVTPSGSWGSPALMLGKPGASNPTYPFITSPETQQIVVGSNSYWDGTNWRAAFAGAAVVAMQQRINYNQITWHTAAAVSQGSTQSFTQAMTLDASGNVGIGRTPLGKFDIFAGAPGQVSYFYGGSSVVYSDIDTHVFRNAVGTERMRIDSSGYLLVGTTTTGFGAAGRGVVDISGSGSAILGFTVGGTTTGYVFHDGTDMSVMQQRNGFMAFGTNNTERMRIVSGGEVLIGTTSVIGVGAKVNILGGGNVLHIQSTNASANNFVSYNSAGSATATLTNGGALTISGALSKGSGSFRIDHPLKPDTYQLVHSFIEGPQADLIYRGKATLVNGKVVINIDEAAGMTEGTFVALCREIQCFTSNECDWDAVRGYVIGNKLTIECQSPSSSAVISWLVIGERQDKHMYETEWTDENGKVIVEPEKVKPMESNHVRR